eukprot:TRINITY_DN2868_c0_g4_i1.p1 TRINITY_DN2868_c0_g4~~TRINITY_DN2868_c0_g4_i1.p1  ORF type:complete len:739 (+),score=137.78 TRINITY_DN2868_c0_g4_i1:49-2265(+)
MVPGRKVVKRKKKSATATATKVKGKEKKEKVEKKKIEEIVDQDNEGDSDFGDFEGDDVIQDVSSSEGGEQAESDSYSSDDEYGNLTRTGDIPLQWYEDEDHAGYDVEGKKIIKHTKDALSKLISKFDDPSELMTVYDKLTGKGHKLSKEDVELILRLQKGQYTDPNYDPYPEAMEFRPWKQNPFDKGMPSKARFQPSKHEMKIVSKLIQKLKRLEKMPPEEKEDPDAEYLLWNDNEEEVFEDRAALRRRKFLIGPPKAELPSTLESYNPPLEYLPTEEQRDAIKAERPIDQPDFITTKYDCLRHVPWYKGTLRERYQRCLDLYAFTRREKQKVDIVPDSLLPDLPKPEELRPYPQKLAFVYKGHTAPVRSVSVNHNGQYLATACDDHFARIYEVNTGRLVSKYNLRAPVSHVAWNPNPMYNILAAASDKIIHLIVNTSCATGPVNEASVEYLKKGDKEATAEDAMQIVSEMHGEDDASDLGKQEDLDAEIHDPDAPEKDLVEWVEQTESQKLGIVLKAVHHHKIVNFAWHHKGDYFATLCPRDKMSRQIVLVQLTVRSSLSPFRRFKEKVQCLSFHPTQPYLLIGTARTVRVYNLVQSQLVKKLRGTVNSISSIDPHAGGDNILVGSHDGPVMWYDMDMSEKPYKKLNSHKQGVQTVKYHPQPNVYPLFASASDSGQIHIFHGRVYDDLTKNAFLVPLKIIKGHRVTNSVGILSIAFHPTLPWLFSAAADGTVKCWTE